MGDKPQISMDRLLKHVDNLPTLPVIATKISQMINDPRSDCHSIAELIKQDPSLTARILVLANSSFYSISGGVSDIHRASAILGLNSIHQLVVTVSVFKALPHTDEAKFSLKDFWLHSLGCAAAAELLGKQLRRLGNDELFTAGLLRDIGKVVLAAYSPETFIQVVQTALQNQKSFRETEVTLGLPPHDEVGRRLAEKWHLPSAIIAGIGYHHKLTPEVRFGLAKPLYLVADLIALADLICRRAKIGKNGDEILPEIDPALLARVQISEETFQAIESRMPQALEERKEFLNLLS